MMENPGAPLDNDPAVWANWTEGRPLGDRTLTITADMLKAFRAGLPDRARSHETKSADGREIVPTVAITRHVGQLTLNAPDSAVPHSTRNTGQEYEFIRPIYVGDVLTLKAKTGYMRPGGGGRRVLYASEVDVLNQAGEVVAKVTSHRTYRVPDEPPQG